MTYTNPYTTAAGEMNRVLWCLKKYSTEIAPRGNKVKETLDLTLDIDPLYPCPHFESRPFNLKYFAGEMCWYLSRDRDPKDIIHFAKFWETLKNPFNGTVNSNYGSLIFNDQMSWAYNQLCKDMFTRQAVMFFNRPIYQFEGNKDFICTLNMLFYIRDNKLNARVSMRSQDIIRGYSYDVPFFSFVLQYMRLWLQKNKYPDLELGKLLLRVDNIHIYEDHFELMDSILNEKEIIEQPRLELKEMPFHLDKYGEYKIYPFVKEMSEIILRLGQNKHKKYDLYKEQLSKLFILE